MELLLIPIWLSLFAPALVSASKPYYVITVPAQMVYPSVEKACITILNLQGELKLKMELKRDERIQLVTEDTINTPNYLHCYSFQLPKVVDEEEVWLFYVSAQGENINIDKPKKVMLYKGTHVTFIQTDKPNYKPGQTVSFRVVTLDKNFQAQNDKYPLVEIMDPNNNRIEQWLDVAPNQGIADFTFPLAKELLLGDYTINIPKVYSTTFSVTEYVLKRFELIINSSSKVPVIGEPFIVEICGSYTYGKPVLGSMNLSVCIKEFRPWERYYLEYIVGNTDDEDLEGCQQIKEVQTTDRGCLSRAIDLSFFSISNKKPYQYLKVRSSLTEDNTGHKEEASAFFIFQFDETMEFVDIAKFYQRGIPLTVKLRAIDKKMEPKVNETVYLIVGFENEDVNLTSVTNEKGIATFTMDTSTWDDMVSMMGKFSLEEERGPYAYDWLYPFYSETNSYLKVEAFTDNKSCDTDVPVIVKYYINKSELDPQSEQLPFFFLLLSKGIASSGEYKLDLREQSPGSVLQGTFSVKIPKTIELFPDVTFLVFTVLLNGDVAASKKKIEIPTCLKNKVELKFSKEKVQPGERVKLEVTAESGSFCSVRSVDKGLLLHKQHKPDELPTEMIKMMSETLTVNKRGFPYAIEDFEKYPCLKNKNQQSEIQEGVWYHNEADVFTLLKESNLKVFTNTKIRKPVQCPVSDYTKRISKKKHNTVELDTSPYSARQKDPKKPVRRKSFPDTWLYDLVSVGPQGRTMLNLTTPDSITQWVTDAFCLGNSGFGSVADVVLNSFQPYFIDLILPYSVVQGEKFTVTAIAFNYLKDCMMVFVSLTDLGDYKVHKNKEQSRCICTDQSTSFTWNLTASKPGNIKVLVSSASLPLHGGCTDKIHKLDKNHREDNVEKTILVKPLGILEEKTTTSLLCPQGNSIRTKVALYVPDRTVAGTDLAHITVLGDVMGSAIANLGESLSLPSGCGENNLVTFIPTVYIVKYLESTKQITSEIKTKALTYLITGYQRQLMFKNDNGSYSTYHGSQGSTWLTAFTVKSFSHAKDLIYIQDNDIVDAVRWLSSLQLPNGCFENVGTIFNNYLTRKAEDEVTLTAYIAIALMEHGRVYNNTVVEKALQCLKDAVDGVNTIYNQALLAYAFTLSGDKDLRQHMLKVLEKVAIRKDGSKHWAADASDNGDVEISAYVLLAILSDQTTSPQDIAEASTIIRWIIRKQRPQGGFYSTQDTVVALQGLTKYAKATYRDNQDVTVTVGSLSGFRKQFHVDKSKSLLLQRESLPDIPGRYTVTATGNGCVYIQTHLKYNIPPAQSDTYFVLRVSTQPSVCTQEAQTRFEVFMEFSYLGDRTETNMILLEVEVPSGFLPSKTSVKKLAKNPAVKRTELTPEKVIIYLEKLTRETESLGFSIKQLTHVRNLQAANVKIFDYYDPDELAVAEYNSPCSTVEGHCTHDVSERKDCGYPSISREECEQRGCCFDSSVSESNWCFFRGLEKEEGLQ
ncbi:alpha-2-macroglobulin-like protein 1 [Mixophyes fleayi]|uniref:alpha-2-macroglobulin-like protein 1 n=1 Tax=Mixophyes fleayi TaxID=3061075 RepID=UPI003F4D8573